MNQYNVPVTIFSWCTTKLRNGISLERKKKIKCSSLLEKKLLFKLEVT